jgi:hypothetical protein
MPINLLKNLLKIKEKKMLNVNWKILAIAAVVSVSGCGTSKKIDVKMTCINGGLIVQNKPYFSVQEILFTYENKSNEVVKPEISTRFYDANGNTIREQIVSFDNIDPGRNQLVSRFVSSLGRPIKTMKVLKAYDKKRCFRSFCDKLCVDGSTFTWK